MIHDPSNRCPEHDIVQLLALMETEEAQGRALLAQLIQAYPGDERLHFLDGSLLAADRDYGAAREAMQRAVELAPGFALARFQLGFLLLSSGEADAALASLAPLRQLPDEDPLRSFAEGLEHLIRDDFDDAIRLLEQGIALNTHNQPLNHDMALLVREMRARQESAGKASQDEEPVLSAAQQLLQQAALKSTRH